MAKFGTDKTITKKFYITLIVLNNSIAIVECDISHNPDYVTLGTKEITFDIPEVSETQIKLDIIKNLQTAKEKLLVEHFMELKEVDDKIQNLLSIDYVPIVNNDEELPF